MDLDSLAYNLFVRIHSSTARKWSKWFPHPTDPTPHDDGQKMSLSCRLQLIRFFYERQIDISQINMPGGTLYLIKVA